jgi:hypothetical protein
MDEPQGTVLNLAEAAKFLKLGYESTKELFERGELPGTSLNQKHVVFLRDDLIAYLRITARQQAAERRGGEATPHPKPRARPARSAGRPRRARLPDLSRYEGKSP